MSDKNENIKENKNKIQSLTKRDNLYYLKELKTTHSGWVCINYNSEYLREKLFKLKEESNSLRQKINIIENQNLQEKNDLEKIILTLREDNNSLKHNYEIQKVKINKLSKENQNLINELKELKNINNNLNNDKEILLGQIKELNNIMCNISPKLKNNENDLLFLKTKISESEKEIISLKNEKIRLLDDNNNKSELIKVLTNQNKNLLNEIKMKYNKDLSFIESIEKMGIEKNINEDVYQEMINKYNNNEDNNTSNFNKIKNKKKIMNYSYDNNDISNNKENEMKIKSKKQIINILKRNKKNNSINKNIKKD